MKGEINGEKEGGEEEGGSTYSKTGCGEKRVRRREGIHGDRRSLRGAEGDNEGSRWIGGKASERSSDKRDGETHT